jgi:hypothetical protein
MKRKYLMQHLVGKEIQFTNKIEEMEAYSEGGMRARIVSITEEDTDSANKHDHIFIITFDYSEYDEYNKRFETANYYGPGRDAVADKTAREVGQYHLQEKIYFGSPKLWPFEEYFVLLNEKSVALYNKFKASGSSNYVEWLEQMVDIS